MLLAQAASGHFIRALAARTSSCAATGEQVKLLDSERQQSKGVGRRYNRPQADRPPGVEVPMSNELAPSAHMVDVKAGKVSRDLYDLDPEEALNPGCALHPLRLPRKA